MARYIPESELEVILEIVRASPDGTSVGKIEKLLAGTISRRTLQYRLKHLVESGRLVRQGSRRWSTYHTGATTGDRLVVSDPRAGTGGEHSMSISTGGKKVQRYVRQATEARRPVGYDRSFMDGYRPNESSFFTEAQRDELRRAGRPTVGTQPAGTFARQILDRLLIDLSWNSSRLEGNTYSLLDTRRLIAFSREAEGKDKTETQMILNHKDAIEFLVDSSSEIGFNRYSILNLHALLANNMLPDPAAPGRLRRIVVGIQGSAYHPLEVPQLIEECFEQFLATAEAIEDPFEQSFFTMVYLPYLQPFDNVNKHVSRLAANIPLVKADLCPLSFTDVPRQTYIQAMLGIYELEKVELLRDVFLWAYRRSADRYSVIIQSLGEPDAFRMRYRDSIRLLVSEIVNDHRDRRDAILHVEAWTAEKIALDDREQFIEVVESELLSLHEGNFARYRVKPSDFEAWQDIWNGSR